MNHWSKSSSKRGGDGDGGYDSSWQAEYGCYMIEGTPDEPYAGFTDDLLKVEENMRQR